PLKDLFMIAVLSVRYRKYVAWLLYFVFFGDWAMAAEMRDVPMGGHAAAAYNATSRYEKHGGEVMAVAPEKRPVAYATPTAMEKEKKAADKATSIVGPDQPEMQAFKSVNSNNMVD